MAKRTGLGRGIGSLIPTTENTNTRPVDVFFPNAPKADQPPEESSATVLAPPAPADEKSTTAGPKRRSASKGSTASAAKQTDAAEVADSDAVEELVAVPGARLIHIDPHAIVPNPRQPRREFDPNSLAELVHSVREFGLLQPVVVRETNDGAYELIMGERRTRAAREAGLDVIPAIVRDTADEDLLRDALLENLHRAELNPLEEASAYQQLLEDFGTTQDELARRIGRSRPQISNTIRLLRLPVPVQQRVAAGRAERGARAGDPVARERGADGAARGQDRERRPSRSAQRRLRRRRLRRPARRRHPPLVRRPVRVVHTSTMWPRVSGIG